MKQLHIVNCNILYPDIFLFFVFLKGNKAELPELTTAQLKKLRQLTIVSLATKSKVLIFYVL